MHRGAVGAVVGAVGAGLAAHSSHRSLLVPLSALLAQVITLDALVQKGTSGLMSCGCDMWLQFTWCKHACVDALRKKIITGFPPNLDPTVLQKRKQGRPSAASKSRYK